MFLVKREGDDADEERVVEDEVEVCEAEKVSSEFGGVSK